MKFAFLSFVFASVAFGQVSRGGFGLLFPDGTSLRNPGQRATESGFAAQLAWGKFTGSHEQSLTPAITFGNGDWAVGAQVSRYGMALTGDQSQEGLGAGWGFSRGPFTLGLSMELAADPQKTIARTPTDPFVQAVVGYRAKGGFGAALGLGTTFHSTTGSRRRMSLAVGMKQESWRNEVTGQFNEGGDWEMGLFSTWQGEALSLSMGANYLRTPNAPQALFRAGYQLGDWELSAFFTYVIKNGENPFHGGALRWSL